MPEDDEQATGPAFTPGPELRFMPLETVMASLSVSKSQAYALVRTGELRAIRVGGRGQRRVSEAELKAYVERAYAELEAELREDSVG